MLYSEDSRQEQEYYTAAPIFASRLSDEPLPKYKMKKEPTDPQIVYQILKDELLDEGNARQNLATFCQTYMEPLAVRLLSECMEKNAIDKSEYPQTAEIENRCVNMIADLWNGPQGYIGTSTVGSSRACMLGGMAMKFRWRKEAKKAGIDIRKEKAKSGDLKRLSDLLGKVLRVLGHRTSQSAHVSGSSEYGSGPDDGICG